jgi:hypothetical protein
MLPSKILATRQFRRGFGVFLGLCVLNAALLFAGDPIAQSRVAHDTGEVRAGTDVLVAGGEIDREPAVSSEAAVGLTLVPLRRLQTLSGYGLSSDTVPARR